MTDKQSVLDVNELRERLRNMSDTVLLRWGQAAAGMVQPGTTGAAHTATLLELARVEWRRRAAVPQKLTPNPPPEKRARSALAKNVQR